MTIAPRVPRLTSARFVLREWTYADVPTVREAGRDPYIPLITTVPGNGDDEECRAFVERQWRRAAEGSGYSFAAAEWGPGRAIGHVSVSLRDADQGRASLGYWLLAGGRGRGAAAELLRTVADWTLTELGLPRLELHIEPWNRASIRTGERAGFVREGLLRRWREIGGERRDLYLYSRLDTDPFPPAHPEGQPR
ncbi:RimJ/RimL family protein N-acetyltransferase [Prauserella shujinwangii]|uniref:RimJ/RimL family protein N-acetyltransferase n=1 Tax=Prauserella shujinwangii TaxID=1453103 RepID=A0A2T0LKI8_9PSEU|nr:GNAT family protein [Prauserella shujinwangii]PRX43407.1 RimJ/RimL family protein N-acetyltransferase [Prauserella shujinwangii]